MYRHLLMNMCSMITDQQQMYKCETFSIRREPCEDSDRSQLLQKKSGKKRFSDVYRLL